MRAEGDITEFCAVEAFVLRKLRWKLHYPTVDEFLAVLRRVLDLESPEWLLSRSQEVADICLALFDEKPSIVAGTALVSAGRLFGNDSLAADLEKSMSKIYSTSDMVPINLK